MRLASSCGMLRGVRKGGHIQRRRCAVLRQGHLIAVVSTFLIGCAVLMAVGCAGVRSEAPKEQEQGHTEATKEQAHSPGATTSEEAQCEGTRTITIKQKYYPPLVTNDVPGCPNKGGLLPGTDKPDTLEG